MKEKIVLCGAGNRLDMLVEKSIRENLQWKVIGIADKNKACSEYAIDNENYEIISYEGIVELDFDYIIITSAIYFFEIRKELIMLNIDKKKIFGFEEYILQKKPQNINLDMLYGKGVDIGGPSGIFYGLYLLTQSCDIINYSKENVWGRLNEVYEFEGKEVGQVIESDATDLRIDDLKYDYVLSSNNLEHIANPIKAVYEWKRVLKEKGILILVVPNKKYNFDHNRDVVKFDHLIQDYLSGVAEDDLTHVPEILEKHDLKMDIEAGDFDNFKSRCYENYHNRCLHHHVFDDAVLEKIALYTGLEKICGPIETAENWIIILRKK